MERESKAGGGPGDIDRRGGECDADHSIYLDLSHHQRTHNWYGRDLFSELHTWIGRFCTGFKLDVQAIVLRVDRLPVSVLGHFRGTPNSLGLSGEVALNVNYLTRRPYCETLAILLHQCLHAWQHVHGSPSPDDHHNLEFRSKAAEVGLFVDRRGNTKCLIEGPFAELLRARNRNPSPLR